MPDDKAFQNWINFIAYVYAFRNVECVLNNLSVGCWPEINFVLEVTVYHIYLK